MTTLATKISRSVSFQESPVLATARRLQRFVPGITSTGHRQASAAGC